MFYLHPVSINFSFHAQKEYFINHEIYKNFSLIKYNLNIENYIKYKNCRI